MNNTLPLLSANIYEPHPQYSPVNQLGVAGGFKVDGKLPAQARDAKGQHPPFRRKSRERSKERDSGAGKSKSINVPIQKATIDTQAILSSKRTGPEEAPGQANRYYEMTQAKKASHREGLLAVRGDGTLPVRDKYSKTEV